MTSSTPEKRKGLSSLTPQVRLLTGLIESQPETLVHYLLRGEEWLVCGQFEQARTDFEQVRAQVEKFSGESTWYIYQAYLDRAEVGLQQCR